METKNTVFIATSLDGFIADKNGEIDWLNAVPNPDNSDIGYVHFMSQIDAIVMGRTTFEIVMGFDVDWPYSCPVFVLSHSLTSIPEKYQDKVILLKGSLKTILETVHQKGYHRLYIDGGATVQGFLKEDLIDELIVTKIPILLGGGIPLFSGLDDALEFEHVKTEVFLKQLVQSHYRRKRNDSIRKKR